MSDVHLRGALGSQGYSLGADGEVDQARPAVALMSKRSSQIARGKASAEAHWRDAHPGEDPPPRAIAAWKQAAWRASRRPKGPHESPQDMAARIAAELGDAGIALAPRAPLAPSPGLSVAGLDRDALAGAAIQALSAKASAWGTAELASAVYTAMAAAGVIGDSAAVLDAAADCVQRAQGRCVSLLGPSDHAATSMSAHLSAPAVIEADNALNLALARLAGAGGSRAASLPTHAAGGAEAVGGAGLDAGQREAAAAIAATTALEVVIGPAGTGKTTMLGATKAALVAQGRSMVVLAPTLAAVNVAAEAVGVPAFTLDKFLYEHGWRHEDTGPWHRMAVGELNPRSAKPYRGPWRDYVVGRGGVVVLDEASLATVDQVNALAEVIADSGAALRLVGDPRQLPALGRGGVMETAARWSAPVSLAEVHRFLRLGTDEAGMPATVADTDYAALSLELRDPEHPERLAAALVATGAVQTHATRPEALAALAAEIAASAGREGALAVTVSTNDDAFELCEAVRALRVAAGAVDDTTVAIGRREVRIGAGDRIVTRLNDAGAGVANRDAWVVDAVGPDGCIQAHYRGRRASLDASYVAANVELGYATTDYGTQGRTTDRSVTWVSRSTSAAGLYVGATRGRFANAIHVVAPGPEAAGDVLVAAMGRDRADRGIDAARAAAQREAQRVVGIAPSRALDLAAIPGPVLAHWRTASELDAESASIEAALAARLEALGVLRPPDQVGIEAARADKAAEASRLEAAAAAIDADIAALGAARRPLAEAALTDGLARRAAAATIAAGPGPLGIHARRVEAARQVLSGIDARWPSRFGGPNEHSSDEVLRRWATAVAEAKINAEAAPADERAAQARSWATQLRREIEVIERNAARQRGEAASNAAARRLVLDAADSQRAVIAARRAERETTAAQIGPEGTRMLDEARAAVVAMDLEHWYIPAELDAQAVAIEAALRERLAKAPEVGLPDPESFAATRDAQSAQATALDAQAAAAAAEAARLRGGRGHLVEAAITDAFARREAARIIAAGPGPVGIHARRVEVARQSLAGIDARWPSPYGGPGPHSSDDHLRAWAHSAADAALAIQVAPLADARSEAQDQASALRRRIASTEATLAATYAQAQRNDAARRQANEAAISARAANAAKRAERDRALEYLPPTQVAMADAAKSLAVEGRERIRSRELARSLTLEHSRTHEDPRRDRGRQGPGLSM